MTVAAGAKLKYGGRSVTVGKSYMSDYTVGRIPGNVSIDPEAGGEERRRKRDSGSKKGAKRDSITISDEARRRSDRESSGVAGEEG